MTSFGGKPIWAHFPIQHVYRGYSGVNSVGCLKAGLYIQMTTFTLHLRTHWDETIATTCNVYSVHYLCGHVRTISGKPLQSILPGTHMVTRDGQNQFTNYYIVSSMLERERYSSSLLEQPKDYHYQNLDLLFFGPNCVHCSEYQHIWMEDAEVKVRLNHNVNHLEVEMFHIAFRQEFVFYFTICGSFKAPN